MGDCSHPERLLVVEAEEDRRFQIQAWAEVVVEEAVEEALQEKRDERQDANDSKSYKIIKSGSLTTSALVC